MSAQEPETPPAVPPAGEEIHLPGPSILPLLTAVGITLAVIGLTTFYELSILGAIITIYCIVKWSLETREEMKHLPSEDGGSH